MFHLSRYYSRGRVQQRSAGLSSNQLRLWHSLQLQLTDKTLPPPSLPSPPCCLWCGDVCGPGWLLAVAAANLLLWSWLR